jgi:hypothetical protein
MFIFVISSVIHSILNYKENKKFEKRICCVGHISLPNNVFRKWGCAPKGDSKKNV